MNKQSPMEQPEKYSKKEDRLRRMILFTGALVCLIMWLVSAGGPAKQHDCSSELAEFERILHKKERFLKEEILKLEMDFASEDPMDVLSRN